MCMWMPGILQRPETQDFSRAKVTDIHKMSKKGDGNWIQVFCNSNKHSKPLNHLCSPVLFLRVELLYTQQKSHILSLSLIHYFLSLSTSAFLPCFNPLCHHFLFSFLCLLIHRISKLNTAFPLFFKLELCMHIIDISCAACRTAEIRQNFNLSI